MTKNDLLGVISRYYDINRINLKSDDSSILRLVNFNMKQAFNDLHLVICAKEKQIVDIIPSDWIAIGYDKNFYKRISVNKLMRSELLSELLK
jgi:hypothetical protein